jgi:hypothetical protein
MSPGPFASEDKNQLVLFLGKGDGTFHAPKYFTVAFPSGQQSGFARLTIPEFTVCGMADFNGDTTMDLVGTAGNSSDLIFLLGVSTERPSNSPYLVDVNLRPSR